MATGHAYYLPIYYKKLAGHGGDSLVRVRKWGTWQGWSAETEQMPLKLTSFNIILLLFMVLTKERLNKAIFYSK